MLLRFDCSATRPISWLARWGIVVAAATLGCIGCSRRPEADSGGGLAKGVRDDRARVTEASAGEAIVPQRVGKSVDAEGFETKPIAGASGGVAATLQIGPSMPAYVAPTTMDLAKTRTLYVVNYAHLDTQWRWTFPTTIQYFLPTTVQRNAQYFDRFPSHVFNFTGASRYQLIEEYYPSDFQRIKDWVRLGRWFPAGNQWEECDVLVPSSESILRQILYGGRYFSDRFGTESQEFMLPDSFGFPASLPSILAHAGLRGFSTQKLTWKPAVEVPFNIGRWQGVDGRGVIAALDPGDYGAEHREIFSTSEYWSDRLDDNGSSGGLKVDYLYNGTGDRGGAPRPVSMATVEKSLNTPGPVKVVVGPSDLMFRHIGDFEATGLPKYEGDLLLREHSAGSLSSQAFIKRLNRANELLADAAERASVVAELLGGGSYPAERLRDAWRLTLRGQFHDIITGTSLPKAYEYSWNDEFLAMNEFAGAISDAVAAVARGMDTQVEGVPVVLYNPLSVERTDLVEALLPPELRDAPAITARNEKGELVATQLTAGSDGQRHILFSATVPAVGFAVYGLQTAASPAGGSELKSSERMVANARYRVTIGEAGDVVSVYDTGARRELLTAPIRMAFQTEWPSEFPAWNMDWIDRKQPPRSYLSGSAKISLVETGPVRVALRVERESEGSWFDQTIRLAAGSSGDRVEFVDRIDWRSTECSLKASFPFTVSNPLATYNWDLGTVQRGNNQPSQYEVPTHGWLDLTDSSGEYGVTLLTGPKYGSDKPKDDILRLTLLFTPAAPDEFHEQSTQDWGRHDITYALVGHSGDWRSGKAQWHARRLEQPILAFRVPKHPGKLGRRYALLSLQGDQVAVQAIKRGEDGSGIVVRMQELLGREARTHLRAVGDITSAWETNGVEKGIAPLEPRQGTLPLDFLPNQIRTVNLSMTLPIQLAASQSRPLDLEYDLDAISPNDQRNDGDFDGKGATYPAEMVPGTLALEGIVYRLGPRAAGQYNAVVANGQKIALPAGYSRLHVLAASVAGRVKAPFRVGDSTALVDVAPWSGYLGQWDNRVFRGAVPEMTFSIFNPVMRIDPAYLQLDRVAWAASHQHDAQLGDRYYEYCYLYSYALDLPTAADTLTLPKESRLRIFALTVSRDANAGALALVPLGPELARDARFSERFGSRLP